MIETISKTVMSLSIITKTIINFQESNNLTETIFLLPKSDYEDEIKKAIPKTNIKIKKLYIYDADPTKLTKQIENITKYQERKLDLKREIEKLKKELILFLTGNLKKTRCEEYLKKRSEMLDWNCFVE